jgi:hypothetical protein
MLFGGVAALECIKRRNHRAVEGSVRPFDLQKTSQGIGDRTSWTGGGPPLRPDHVEHRAKVALPRNYSSERYPMVVECQVGVEQFTQNLLLLEPFGILSSPFFWELQSLTQQLPRRSGPNGVSKFATKSIPTKRPPARRFARG